jgi:hypothetical protein
MVFSVAQGIVEYVFGATYPQTIRKTSKLPLKRYRSKYPSNVQPQPNRMIELTRLPLYLQPSSYSMALPILLCGAQIVTEVVER